ncbi:tetratricopeptide repeat-containing sulfotransferase family protein [Sphingomonas flavalba]|uniref:tetratricopeptide repeat-containing sulfotransferase family protein n=1 Tax=Sphingomonas flavalba TaxID=2559804 RepID=UPI00109E1D8E|nr:sulfotransferase [Sphingomonas flavalba]
MTRATPPPAAIDAARTAIVEGRIVAARAAVDRLIARWPDCAQAHFLASRLAAVTGDPAREMEALARAAALDPTDPLPPAFLARLHARARQVEQALALARQAEALAGTDAIALDAVATAFAQCGEHRAARDALARAAAAGSLNPAVHFNLGTQAKFLGAFDEARAAYETAIRIAPDYHKAHAALTSLGGMTATDNHLDRLLPLIAATPDPRRRIHVVHAAARELEQIGRHDEAFTLLARGKADLRAVLPPEPVLPPPVEAIAAAVDATALPPAEDDPDGPIFVVGMPRSGTTVVDRILSGHPRCRSLGEPMHAAAILRRASGSTGRALLDQPMLDLLARSKSLVALGDAYRALARGRDGPVVHRTIDKMHLNVLLVGHIMAMLPGARVVCLVRDPLDTVASNFRQLFEFDSPIYRYSLDIEDTARFVIAFRALERLWRDRFPDRFLSIHYEDLVRDPRAGTARLLAFCGLGWDEACVHIERNAGAVTTASAVQVRQPINAASVGAWRRYARQVEPARRLLHAAGYAD